MPKAYVDPRTVLSAEPADEQLVQERSLVAGPAGRVEDGPVRIAAGGERTGHDVERTVPADRAVVILAGAAVDGLGEPALANRAGSGYVLGYDPANQVAAVILAGPPLERADGFAFSADGQVLASISEQGSLKLWSWPALSPRR